jgi:filamentous hemagglutinin
MNKNLFRIIFNKRRGQLMAVAETSSSQGKGAIGETTASGEPTITNSATVAIGAIGFAVLCALGAVLWALPTPNAHAQVVAYRNAPGSQQPTVLQAANSVPQIDIQTPSAAGVSRNVYSQFDVQSNGAILNNSRTSVQTQQGGWIQGNPWLATGSARVILNEVNSSNPSYLNGYVEVAGQRAEVVIANPSGISVNGGGFINTSKATLTTGTPVVNNGNIDSYRVQGGNISINGKGLDLSTTDYSAILARAVQVNAGIWANELKVVTGANQIDASSLGANTTPVTTTIADTGAVPSFALDVAQIGGMYAGKIHLIGTEQGLGVRSAGTIGSTGGDLVLQNNGWLTNTGALQASANLQITTQGNITNSGTLYASNDQTLSATGNVTNSGVIAAQGNTSITANSLSSTAASVVGAGIKTDGTLVGNGNLNVTTTQGLAANGQNLAAGNIALTGSSVDLSGSQTGAANIAITANSGNVNTANATVATSSTAGVLNITAKSNNDQTLDNTHGTLSAGQLNLDIANLTNTQGQITQTGVGKTSIVLTSPTSTFNNTGGTLTVNSANLEIAANTLTNTDGKIQHAGTRALSITADTLSSVRGQVASNNNVALTIGTQLNNTDGVISAAKDLSVSAEFAVTQPSGSTELNNTRGLIQATAGNLNLNVGNLDNTQGSVYAHTDLTLASTGTITNMGFIAAQGNATLSANSLNSSSTSVLGAGIKADGTLANSGDLKITTTQALNANGQNLAAGNTTLSGSSVSLSGSQTGAANIGITATSGDVNTSKATVATAGTLSLAAKTNDSQTLNNFKGILSAKQLNLDVANLINTQGQITQTGIGDTTIALTSPTSTLNNTGGTIATNSANLNLKADTLNNTDGQIQHAGTDTLSIAANSLTNLRGQIVGNQNTTLQLAKLDNTQGSVYASKDLNVAATGSITNTGFIAAQGNTTLSANSLSSDAGSVLGSGVKTDGTLTNSGDLKITTTQALNANGQNLAAGNATLSGSSVNLSGSQTGAANIGISATSGDVNTSSASVATSGTTGLLHIVAQANANNAQTLNNRQGVLSAGQINLEVSKLDNTQATIVAGHGDLSVTTHAFDNTDGKLQSIGSGNLSVAADALTNLRGQIFSNQTATLQLASLDNTQGSVYASKNLSITVTDAVTNTGFIAAQGNASITANSLSSSSTSVLGAGVKTDGTLTTSGNLSVVTAQALSANGQNLAAGNTTLSGSSVNLSGSQTGAANIGITATSGDVNTSNTTVATAGTLNITAKAKNNQTLNNTQGVLSAGQLNVDVTNFNNTKGQAIQTGTGDTSIVLTSPTGVLNNTNGTIATNSVNLNLSTETLTNTDGKIQYAGTGTLHITATTLNDQRGQMVSNNALVIDAGTVDHRSANTAAKNIALNATSLNNTEGEIIQTGNGAMTIATTQGIDNTTGKLASNGKLTLSAQSLTNNQGQVSALGDLTVSISTTHTVGAPQNAGVLSNLQGLVAAKGNVAITAASVENTLGTLASVDKNLNITSKGTTINDSGKIQAALDITLTNAGLSNTRTTNALATSTTPYGSIIGRNVDINTNTQTLNNEGGTIVATQSANLQTGAVNNNGGLIQTGSDLTINTHGLTLTNTNAANYTSSNTALNGKGGIAAQGTTTLTTGNLNNDAGYIGSKGALTATAANISNQAGQIQGLGNLTLSAGDGSSTGTINNTGGLIRSGATTSLSAGTVTNSNTSGSGLGIEGLDVSVSATTLRNDSGAIRADNNITVTSAGTVNNSAGLMSAGNTLTLQDVQTQANRTLAITNTNGTLLAGQSLSVAASSVGGDGSILSKGSLNLALNADFANSGQVIANGKATINTSGNVSNSGKLQAGNTLNLTANNIDNTATGEISANTTQLNASSTLTNRGLIDGTDTQINANTVNNIGTGRIYDDHLSITAVNLTNDTETIAGVTKAGTIAARDRLDLGISGTLTNREHALIYSLGDMAIGGALDANRQATGSATTLNNNSATIEAGRNLSLSSTTVNNTNDHFTYETRVATTELDVREDISSGLYRVFTRTTYLPYQTASDPAQILASVDINLNSSNATNYASHIVAGGALNIGSSTLANTDVMATKSIRDVGTTYTLVHVPGSGICGKISINCVRAHDEWQTAPYDSTAESTVSVAQVTASSNSGAKITSLASGTVNQTVGSIGSSTARSGSVSSPDVSVTQSGATQANAASGTSASSSVSAVSSSAGTTNSISSASNTNIETPSTINGTSTSTSSRAGQAATQTLSVRGAHPKTTLPTSSLFKNNPSITSAYLIETDTRFIDRKLWLGSDYMTQSLSLDPTVTQKRLGDGFYEQKLIREQVAELTGRRFLADYTSDEQEYKALMNSAITFGQKYNLRPGIALTAQQVAQLTSDIVWLVEQTVTLPDGSSQKVLVPQLYVKVQQGDLDGSGALLAGKDVNLNLSGDLTNSGTIAGRNVVNLTAENVNNLGGRIGGTDVSVAARQDLNNIGGSIGAVNSLSATAGRDLNIQTTTQTTNIQTGIANTSRTGVDRVAGLYVSGANGTLVASAGRDLNIVAGVVSNAGSGTTNLSAGNNFTLASVKTGEQNNIVWNADNHLNYGNTQTVGSTINGGGNVNLKTGNDLTATAANMQAAKALTVQAGGSANILAGENTTNLDEAHKTSSGGGFFGGATLVTRNVSNTSTAVASNFGGGTVDIAANTKDINVKGSNVVSDNGTNLTAGGNVNIEAATNTSQQSSYSQETKSGFSISSLGANPIGVSYSKTKQSDDNQSNSTTAVASTVGSVGGNVNITAGNQYKQVGSDVLTPGGDITITAKKTDIVEARETNQNSSEQKFEQKTISAGLKGGIIDTVQATTQAVQAAKNSSSDRNRNLNALIAFGKGSDAYEQGKATQSAYDKNGVTGGTDADGKPAPGAAAASGIKVSVSIGSSKSQSNSSTTSNTSAASTVKAGGSVNIKATGQGEGEGNLTIQGSNVSAAKDVSLSATKNVNILASADTESNRSSNSSSSTSVGLSVGIGQGGAGLSLDIAASRGKGQANSNSTTYNNSHITGGNQVTITSGADTNVVGGNIKATQVTANVGGNLNVESLQDKAVSEASQKTTGIAMSIPIVGAGGSASFSQNKQKSDSNYASVNEQSGIKAGEGGFTINVKGNTDLKGATIAGSTDPSKNTFTTNTLTTSDISNSMSASASSSGVSVGTNMMDGKYAMGKAIAGNLLNNGSANQSDASTTTSAISAGQVTVGNKTTDTSKEKLTDSNGKTVSTDTTNTNRTLAKADVASLQKSAQDQQAGNMLVLNAAVAMTDPAFKAAFLDQAKMYKKVVDTKGEVSWQEMTPEEKAKIPPGSRVANNGIFNGGPNDPKPAQDLAQQNSSGGADYLVHFPKASNAVSELLVAGYQKFLENGTTGLTNATQQNVDLWKQTGGNITLDGHSRGGMTVGNALDSVKDQGGKGGATNVNLFGSAYNAQDAANTVNQITGGTGQVKQSTNNYDLIGRVLGGNAGTGGTIPESSSALEEAVRTLGGAATVHNCYGAGKVECSDRFGTNYVAPSLTPVSPTNAVGKKP